MFVSCSAIYTFDFCLALRDFRFLPALAFNSLRTSGLKLNVRGLSDAVVKPASFASCAARISAVSVFDDISRMAQREECGKCTAKTKKKLCSVFSVAQSTQTSKNSLVNVSSQETVRRLISVLRKIASSKEFYLR